MQHYFVGGITETRSQVTITFLSTLSEDRMAELHGSSPRSVFISCVTYSILFHSCGPQFPQEQSNNNNVHAVQGSIQLPM